MFENIPGSWDDIKNMDSGEVFFLGLKTLAVGALVFFAGHHLSTQLPKPDQILSTLKDEPVQQNLTDVSSFKKSIGTHVYEIHPKADYLIRGVVVERHDSSSLFDITHAEAGDLLNTHDLCLIWGEDAKSPYLNDITFSHGDWTCYFETKSSAAWSHFKQDQISNNHILPAEDSIYKIIRSARIGDQIEIAGQLVDYSVDNGPSRNTSLIRTDTGNGACEIIYAKDAKILYRNGHKWFLFEVLGKLLCLAGGLLIVFALAILPYLQREEEPPPET